MPVHNLIREKDDPQREWRLSWDDAVFTLETPEGEVEFQAVASMAHHIIDLRELVVRGKFALEPPHQAYTFQRNREAARDLCDFVSERLRADPERYDYCRRLARFHVMCGVIAFLIAAPLFGGYCYWAIDRPDDPGDRGLHWLGPFIHIALLVALALSIAGPYVAYHGLRVGAYLRRVAREAGPFSN